MIYNLKYKTMQCEVKDELQRLIEQEKVVSLCEVKSKRTIQQNSYLHLLLSILANEIGETLEYVKQELFKKHINPVIFLEWKTNKSGEEWCRLKSTTELNTKEMTTAIDRFKDFAILEAGVKLPDAENEYEIALAYEELNKR